MPEPVKQPETVRLYDIKTGKGRDFTPEEAHAAFISGTHSARTDQRVPVRLADGGIGTVAGSDLAGVVQQGGSFATPAEVHHAGVEIKHGGFVGGAKAAAAGAARGLTLGLSDVVGSGLGYGETLADLKEAHPYVSTAGEIAGAVAPTLFTGGAGGAVEGANLARTGVGAARAVEGGIGAARGIEAGIGAARLAEGGMAAAQAIPTAGRFASAAREGLGVVGAPAKFTAHLGELAETGVRSVLGGASSPSFAVRAATKGLSLAARGAVEGAIYGGAGEVSETALGDHELNGEKMLAAIGHGAFMGALTGGALGVGGEALSTGIGKVAPKLQRFAGERAFKAAAGNDAKATRLADAVPGGRAAVGDWIMKEAGLAATDTAESLAPKVARAHAAAIDNLESVVAPVAGEGIPIAKVLGALKSRQAEFAGKLGFESAAKKVESLHDQIASMYAGKEIVPLRDLLQQRRALEGSINWNTDTAVAQGTKAVGRTLEDLVVDHGDEAAAKMGGKFSDVYKAAKLNVRKAIVADDAVTEQVVRMAKNRSASPSDYLSGIGAAVGLGGGPLGLAKGALVGYANKLVRERGNSAVAVALDKVAGLGIVRRAVEEADARLSGGVDALFTQAKRGPRIHRLGSSSGGAKDTGDEYRARVQQVEAMHQEPENADAYLRPMIEHTPLHAMTVATTAERASTYLATKIPPTHQDRNSLTPQLTKPQPSGADMAKFLRTARAVDDPLSILTSMHHGMLTSEEVNAVKAVYPKLYQDMRDRVQVKLAEQTKPLTLSQDTQIRLLFNLRTGWLDPALVGTLQKTYAPSPATPTPQPPQGSPAKFTTNPDALVTAAQRAQNPGASK